MTRANPGYKSVLGAWGYKGKWKPVPLWRGLQPGKISPHKNISVTYGG